MEYVSLACLYAAGFAAAAGGLSAVKPEFQSTRWALSTVWPATGIVVLAVVIASLFRRA